MQNNKYCLCYTKAIFIVFLYSTRALKLLRATHFLRHKFLWKYISFVSESLKEELSRVQFLKKAKFPPKKRYAIIFRHVVFAFLYLKQYLSFHISRCTCWHKESAWCISKFLISIRVYPSTVWEVMWVMLCWRRRFLCQNKISLKQYTEKVNNSVRTGYIIDLLPQLKDE